MSQVCETCGLPHELCVCEDVAKEKQSITVSVDERSYSKKVTIASGFDANKINIDELSSELKSMFACGGTVRDNGDKHSIEMQGDHKKDLSEELESRGYEVDRE